MTMMIFDDDYNDEDNVGTLWNFIVKKFPIADFTKIIFLFLFFLISIDFDYVMCPDFVITHSFLYNHTLKNKKKM